MESLLACPVCGSLKVRLRFEGRTTRYPSDPKRWRVEECTECTLGFINPRPDWEDLRPYYCADYPAYGGSHGATGEDGDVIARAKAQGEFRHLPLPHGKSILDVGCGGGYFLRICRTLGASVHGLEPSAVAAEKARSFGFDVFVGTVEDFTTEKRFDVITANQVLEHVPDPVSSLSKMRTLLAPGGMIWVSVPNANCRWAQSLEWKWDGADLPYHLLHFNRTSLASAADLADLRVKRLYTHSDAAIVRYSMRKHLRQNWGIPEKIGKYIYPTAAAQRLAGRLDTQNAGDTLIAELII